ncbi:response regulator [Roseateles sp.]|uniref:response regulator n=1 Tax=Roseateles sp. TaxID=1971397 RepID=UPI0039E95714
MPMVHLSDSAAAPLVLLAGEASEGAAELLREAGCRVRTAASPAALLRLAGSAPAPQLILLGETVADQPGLSLLSRLRDEAATRAIPVLFVAGGDEELALALGASDCLSLPLRPLVLLARVQTQLRLGELRD